MAQERQAPDKPGQHERDSHFFVPPSAAIQERLPLALKHADSFALFDPHGDILGAMHGPDGIYYRDTRHLSYSRLTLCGNYPMLLGSAIDDRVDALVIDLTNPDVDMDNEGGGAGGTKIPNDVIHINRTKFLGPSGAYERIMLRNFDECAHRVTLELTLGCDFQDMFEVRGDKRAARGQKLASECSGDGVVHRYRGLDDIVRQTAISFDPVPSEIREHRVMFELDLEPGARSIIFMRIGFEPEEDEDPARAFLKNYRAMRQLRRGEGKGRPAIRSSNALFNAMIDRSVADITTLTTQTEQGPCAYAGIPWYCTLFGRDSLITALELLWYDPSLACGTLLRLGALQAKEDDPLADAEPGKILHEMRHGEMANLREVPFGLYYGSVDSTPLYVFLAGEYHRRTGDDDTIDRIWPNIEAALDWIDRSGDRDGDGFFEYGARSGEGLRNQGWKDSHDAISHADGRLADGPIAVVEMQAYVYGAWRAAAAMAERRGEHDDARQWRERAAALKRRFDETFFDTDLGTYILALDGDKQPCRVVASNAGHALLTGIALPERARAVADRLMAPDSFSGWGVRTLAQGEARYNPMSYHNGSIWPHDNALIAAGFARYGFRRETNRLFSALFDSASHFDQHRIPELFCGFSRTKGRGPTRYPVACAPQAWSSATPLYFVKSALGMRIEADRNVDFTTPMLPDFMSKLSLDGLTCDDSTLGIDIQQLGQATSVFVRDRSGDVSVTMSS